MPSPFGLQPKFRPCAVCTSGMLAKKATMSVSRLRPAATIRCARSVRCLRSYTPARQAANAKKKTWRPTNQCKREIRTGKDGSPESAGPDFQPVQRHRPGSPTDQHEKEPSHRASLSGLPTGPPAYQPGQEAKHKQRNASQPASSYGFPTTRPPGMGGVEWSHSHHYEHPFLVIDIIPKKCGKKDVKVKKKRR